MPTSLLEVENESKPAWAQAPPWWINPPAEKDDTLINSWPRPTPVSNPNLPGGVLSPGPPDANPSDPNAPENAGSPNNQPGPRSEPNA